MQNEEEPTVRVLYHLDIDPDRLADLRAAWQEIVLAHREAGHGALESVLLHDPETPRRLIIMSRWHSLEHWETQQTDDVNPEAFARLREVGELQRREVFVEEGRLLSDTDS